MKSLTTILAVLAVGSTLGFAADDKKPAAPGGAPGGAPPAAPGGPEGKKHGGPGGPGGDRPHPMPEDVLKKLDTDNNGSISLDEFKAGPKGQKDPAKAAEFFKMLDKDGNGSVTLEEMKAHHPEGKGGPGGDKKGGPGEKHGEKHGEKKDGPVGAPKAEK